VPRDDVETALSSGKNTIVKVDVQGARNIKRIMPQAVSVFLRPASKGDLAARLQMRKSESAVDLALRLKAAEDEFERMLDFDYVVVNEWGQIDRAVDEISWVISVERCLPQAVDR
jgi:guanylate kinase